MGRCPEGAAMTAIKLTVFAAFISFASGGPTLSECESKTYPKNGSIEPVTFTTPLTELRWLAGKDDADKYVFALTGGKGFEAGGEIYRSDDYGSAKSWQNISSDLPGLLDPPDISKTHYWLRFLRGAIDMHHSWRQPEKVLVQGAGFSNWVSDDFGSLWHQVDTPGKALGYWTQIKMHPNQPDWLLALTKRHICFDDEEAATDRNCGSDLFVSQDFGKSWQNLTENSQGRIASFVDYSWGAHLNFWNTTEEESHDKTIFATAYEDAKHLKGPLPGWDHNVHYVVSHNFFKDSHEKLVSCGNTFEIVSQRVYLAVPSNCPYHPDGSKRKLSAEESVSSSVMMYVSDDRGLTFKEACIPVGDLDLGYQLRSNFFGGGTFLTANHGSQDVVTAQAPVSNIYSSGGDTGLFSLTLPRAFRKGKHTDFMPVDGLPGVFIANRLSFNAFTESAFRWDADDIDYEKYLQTTVSYNGGSHWHPLKQPEKFNYPSCDSCSKLNESWGCQLHLHGPSSWRSTEGEKPAMHSHITAPGVVMAVGNTGEFLDAAADVTCTFLSRDGGESWEDIADHANVFEFGDHGGLLVMARHQTQGPAKFIKFSIDQGRCWHTVNLTEAIDIIDIRVEPTLASHVFMVYGRACEQSEWHPSCSHTAEDEGTRFAGKLYAIDFKELLGEDWKVCEDSDYEKWSVPSPERCLLGRNISMTRRKAEATCFNGKGWTQPEGVHELCDCDYVDVECEYGYRWDWGQRNCTEIPGVNTQSCPAVSSKKYVISDTHLRLLDGDACVNISRIIPDTDGRGHSTLPHRKLRIPKWGIAVLVVLAAVAVIAGLARYMRGRSDPEAGSILEGPVSALGSGVGWLRSKITGQPREPHAYSQPLSGGPEDDFEMDEDDAESPRRAV